MAKYFIISGESSGDRLGGLLASELLKLEHEVWGWGGAAMKKSGVDLTQDIADLKIMGWTDVLRKLPSLISLLKKCRQDITDKCPDTVILIDFGSFNLRVAKWAKKSGYKVVYYSPPKIWASRSSRIKLLKKYCDQVIVLFPFEYEYYKSKGLKVNYYGHPFAEIIDQYQPDNRFLLTHGLDDRPILAILPGSRSMEVKNTLPIYLSAASKMKNYQICISCANGMTGLIKQLSKQYADKSSLIETGYYDLLHHADIAIVTSGTATMEAALFGVPQIVGYKTSFLNYLIAKRLIKTPYISLVNLISNKRVVPELLQKGLTTTLLYDNLIRICRPNAKSTVATEYNGIINVLNIDKCLLLTALAISDN